jgi:lipopolysaccharide transport system permease protein
MGQMSSTLSITVIRSNQKGLALREALERRELLYFLVWRDIKIRYKQTVLGIAWAVLNPAIQLIIFSVIFGRFAGIKSDGAYPYPIFVLAGLVPWSFFAQAVAQGAQSLVNQQHMLTKIYFPRLFVPTGAVGGCVLDYAISFAVFAAVLAGYRFLPSWQVLFLPVLILLTIVAALGAVYLLSALTVAYRDFRYVVPVLIQTLMYLSPVVYPLTIFPKRYQWLLGLNPMAGLIDGFRSSLLGKPWNYPILFTSTCSSLVLLLTGLSYFRQTERRFADIA